MVEENSSGAIDAAMDAAMLSAAAEDWEAVLRHCDEILAVVADHDAASRFRQLAEMRLDAPAESAGPAPAPDERRQLTVMFGDMVGSTQMSQILEPDALREMLRLYQDACTEGIAAWDGFIARWMGDGFMAYFGFPTPHEDAAYRSVMAGLSVIERVEALADTFQERFGVEVGIRLGVHTGLVVIADMGSGEWRQQSDLVGETPNMAARLEAAAPTNGLVISEDTQDLVRGFVNLDPLGPHELKGIDRPVDVYRVLGATAATSRYEAWADPSTPLVGRRDELSRLVAAIDASSEAGSLTIVQGEAGIGKSRLIHEARSRLAARREVLACAGTEMTLSEPLRPFGRLVLSAAGIKPNDPDGFDRLDSLLAPARVSQHDVARVALANGLTPPSAIELPAQTPEQTLRDVAAAYVAWFASVGADRPAMLVVDDAHWLDATSRELVRSLAIAAPDLAVVVATRPLPDDDIAATADTVIRLAALTSDETAQLLQWIVGESGDESIDYSRAISRSDGVPLFAEELGRVLINQGSAAMAEIPNTLHDLLALRLDGLPEAKRLAQVGAAIGREFQVDLLQAVVADDVGDDVTALVEAGVWVRGSRPGTLAFRHALLADAAYDSQLRAGKVEINRRIADTIDTAFSHLVASSPHQVALHRELGEQYDIATALWLQAGMQTAAGGAHIEATGHFRRGLALLDELDDPATRLQLELGLQLGLGASISSTVGYGHAEVEPAFARAQEICSTIGNLPDLFPAVWGSWSFYLVRADYETAASLAADISEMAASSGDPAMAIEAAAVEGITSFYRGDLETASRHFAAVEDLSADHPEATPIQQFQHPVVAARSNAALVSWLRGDTRAALSSVAAAVDLAESCDAQFEMFARGYAATFGGALGSLTGDGDAGLRHGQEGIDVCHQFGSQIFLAGGEMYKGYAQHRLGDSDEGLARLRAAADGYVLTGALLLRPFHLSRVAEIELDLGRAANALEVNTEALNVAEQTQERAFLPMVLEQRARAMNAAGATLLEVQPVLERAVAEADRNGEVVSVLNALVVLHRLGVDRADAIRSVLGREGLDPDHAVVVAAQAAVGQ